MMQQHLRAEWEQQSAILLTWPHSYSDWQDSLDQIEPVYRSMVNAIAETQTVIIIAFDAGHRAHVQAQLTQSKNIQFVTCPTNDTWIRDYGPLTINREGNPVLLDFRFNAWGGKYTATLDDAVSRTLHDQQLFDCPIEALPLVLEGGAIETDGTGTLLATRQSVIDDKRNPGLDQLQLESILDVQLGINHFHWLDFAGVHGDDTDGHIDTIARFSPDQTIVYATCTPDHPDHTALSSLERQLQQLTNRNGHPYQLIPLPCPGIHKNSDSNLLPASYANFLLTNDLVLMPIYQYKNDQEAMEVVQHCYPDRTLVPIDSRALITQNGSIHCATMQIGCPVRQA